MFKDKLAVVVEDFRRKYQIGQFTQPGMIIGGVGENQIKGFDGFSQKLESISPDHGYLIHFHGPAGLLNKFEVRRCHLNCNHRTGPPGSELIGDASGACKKIQYIQLLKIQLMDEDVEQAFFGKISGWPDFKIFGRVYLFSPVCTAYYAHLLPSDKIICCSICSRDNSSR